VIRKSENNHETMVNTQVIEHVLKPGDVLLSLPTDCRNLLGAHLPKTLGDWQAFHNKANRAFFVLFCLAPRIFPNRCSRPCRTGRANFFL
jgi:hypothetical protein